MAKRLLIALGGNAIKQPDEKGTAEEQMRNVETASRQISQLAALGYDLVITHGNGPQVGNLSIQQDAGSSQVPALPLVVLGAMTQGQIGYMMQQSLQNILGEERRIVTVVTQVLVGTDDPDFKDPSKPVGPFYSEEHAKELAESQGWTVKKVKPNGDRVWRRVVPSPAPLGTVEGKTIKAMVDAGVIVIASGGGGIPVYRNRQGRLEGVDAVIDKDRAGASLAEEVDADLFMILTDVEAVMLDYGKPTQRPISRMTVAEAKTHLAEGQFGAGSMGPKVEAAVSFVERRKTRAVITSLSKAVDALAWKTGTSILPG